MKKGTCAKCKKYTWVEEHHILPKPTCHTDFHQHLGQENLKNDDMVYQFYTFSKWLCGLSAVLLLIWWVVNNLS